jgi:hypothetical protein
MGSEGMLSIECRSILTNDKVRKRLFCTDLKKCLSFSNYIWNRERGYITFADEVIKNVGHQMFERPTANILLLY